MAKRLTESRQPYYVEGDAQLGLSSVKRSDKEFREVMKLLFPRRKLVAINPLAVNVGGGGMHCISAHRAL
eukprot:Awhi_evm1s6908